MYGPSIDQIQHLATLLNGKRGKQYPLLHLWGVVYLDLDPNIFQLNAMLHCSMVGQGADQDTVLLRPGT